MRTEPAHPLPQVAPPWAGPSAVLLVALALVLSFVVPLTLQLRIDTIRDEIDSLADPARTHVTAVQFALARQMSSLRGYLLTGEEQFLDLYTETSRQERDAYGTLEPLAAGLGSEVTEHLAELRTLSAQWHSRVIRHDTLDAAVAPALLSARIQAEQALYEQTLAAARDLDLAIVDAARSRSTVVRSRERARQFVTGALVLLGLAATASAAWLGRRVQVLAAETEERRTSAEQALEQLRRTVESRDQFVRGITHDVKNPLSAADGFAALLDIGWKGELRPEQKEVLQSVRRCIADAVAIIHDLLTGSQLEGEELPVQRVEVDLRQAIREVADTHRGAAAAAGVHFEVLAPSEPVQVYTDELRLRRILGNLLTNVIKYAPGTGRAELILERRDTRQDPEGGPFIAIRVRDFGRGIPTSEQENIFLDFYRLQDEQDGHGLGLATSRRLARRLGGDLSVESKPGQGATFTLILPIRREPGAVAAAQPSEAPARRTAGGQPDSSDDIRSEPAASAAPYPRDP